MSRVHGEVERSSACTGQACLAQIGSTKNKKTLLSQIIKNKIRKPVRRRMSACQRFFLVVFSAKYKLNKAELRSTFLLSIKQNSLLDGLFVYNFKKY